MNKKTINYLMYGITITVVVYYILNLTGILVFSNNPTIANEPNIKEGSKTLSSNLLTPEKGDFICYNFKDEYLGEHIRVHRLIGLENDTIEIRNGILFLNNKNFDKNLSLAHYYKFSKVNLEEIYKVIPDYAFTSLQKYDSVNLKILVEDSKIRELKFEIIKVIEEKDSTNKEIQAIFNKNWNKDNFGPVVIPKDKVFVLGDNRDYTLDSRFEGYINKKDITGVVFKIF